MKQISVNIYEIIWLIGSLIENDAVVRSLTRFMPRFFCWSILEMRHEESEETNQNLCLFYVFVPFSLVKLQQQQKGKHEKGHPNDESRIVMKHIEWANDIPCSTKI